MRLYSVKVSPFKERILYLQNLLWNYTISAGSWVKLNRIVYTDRSIYSVWSNFQEICHRTYRKLLTPSLREKISSLIQKMLYDDRCYTQTCSWLIISVSKDSKHKPNELRKFQVPKINFQTIDNTNLIFCQKCHITEPPLIISTKDEELKLWGGIY